MRKILSLILIFVNISLFSVYAEAIDESKIAYKNPIGSLYSAAVEGEGEYLIDGENNILGGPFEYVSDFSGFPYAKSFDGSMTLFDTDGSVIASVPEGGDITYPANGIYCVAPNGDKGQYIYYSYETRTELFRTDSLWMYYLEQQPEKMFIEKDGKWAIINNRGEYLTDFIYDGVKKKFNPDYEPYPKAYAIVVIGGEEKYIDWNLNEINLEDYNGERFITEFYHMRQGYDNFGEFYIAESGDMSAIYDNSTKQFLIPFQKDLKFSSMNEEFITAEKGGKSGIIDYLGNTVVPFEYDSLGFAGPAGLMAYSKGETTGYFDPYRKCEVSDIAGIFTENGIMLNVYSDYSSGYREYCAEIINFAGHNLTGEVYPVVIFENGQYYYAEYYTDTPDIPVSVDRSFAIVKLNGEYLPFDGCIRDSRTLVPMREIVEGLGGTVLWNPDTMTATALIDGNEISMTVGSCDISVNGNVVTIDVPAQLINEKTMLPVRALCENLGAKVEWDERIRCVYITR